MNPFTIFVQSALAATEIVGLVRAGYPRLGEAFAWTCFALAVLLSLVNFRWRKEIQRRKRFWIVDVSPLWLLVPALVHGPGRRLGAAHHVVTVAALFILAGAALLTMLLSSLIDWYYVLPRMTGAWRPCVCSADQRLRRLTRIWIAHRMVAALAVVASTVAIVGLSASSWLHHLNNVVAGTVAAAASIIAGFYLTRFAPALATAINPTLQVGDKIRLVEEFKLPVATAPEYYVTEAAIEGFKLLELSNGDELARPEVERTHDRVLDLADTSKLLFSRDRVLACQSVCRGINPHCGRRRGECLDPEGPPDPPEGGAAPEVNEAAVV